MPILSSIGGGSNRGFGRFKSSYGLSGSYFGTKLFSSPTQYNNNTSNWTVPSEILFVWFKIWGSGAEPDGFVNTFPGGDGGAGGFTQGVITTTPGETLQVAVGGTNYNGGAPKLFGGNGGGFSGVFRGSTPLLIAGGGGGGAVNSSSAGGAGGGTTGQTSIDGYTGGTQSTGGQNASYLTGGSEGGGGGYLGGGGGTWSIAGGGGSGYIGGAYSKGATTTGNYRTPAGTGDAEYPSDFSPGGLNYGYGGIGNNTGIFNYGSGYIIAHCYRVDPTSFTYPVTKFIL